MKTYRVAFEELYETYIEAESKNEARKKFDNGRYGSSLNCLAISMIDITEETE